MCDTQATSALWMMASAGMPRKRHRGTSTAGTEVLINQQPVEWAELGQRLSDIFKSRGQRVAFVQGHAAVEFQHVARAIGVMRGAGIEQVGLLTQKM
jgi:biopolymer transport protein ExbD